VRPYVLGLPRYANVAPLHHFLRLEGFRVLHAVPAELNRLLLSGEVGLSLVSSYFYLKHQDSLGLLPDFSVAVLGRVYSVNLFHKGALPHLARVALTTESATSVALLKLLLKEAGAGPRYERREGGLELLSAYDGVLLIGDRAIKAYAALLPEVPETPHALRRDREVALLGALELGGLLVVHHRARQRHRVLARQRLRRHLGDLAVDLDRRRKLRRQEQVGAAARDQQAQQVVDELGCLVAFHGSFL